VSSGVGWVCKRHLSKLPGTRQLLWCALMGVLPSVIPTVSAADDGALSDPTRPAVVDAATVDAPAAPARLQSILIGPERRLAVIDGELLAEGDRASAFKLEAVLADQVRIRLADGSLRTLAIETDIIRRE